MAAVTIHSDFRIQENKSATLSIFSPFFYCEVMGLNAMILFLQILSLSQLFHSPLSPPSRGSLVPLCFLPLGWYHLHTWGYWYFSPILVPTCDLSSLEFCMIYSVYKLNKQGDNIHPQSTLTKYISYLKGTLLYRESMWS